MIIHTKFSDIDAEIVDASVSKDVETHRWIVHILADMIDYSERNQLPEVTDSLIVAMEAISPSLVSAQMAVKALMSDDEIRNRPDLENVINFRHVEC